MGYSATHRYAFDGPKGRMGELKSSVCQYSGSLPMVLGRWSRPSFKSYWTSYPFIQRTSNQPAAVLSSHIGCEIRSTSYQIFIILEIPSSSRHDTIPHNGARSLPVAAAVTQRLGRPSRRHALHFDSIFH